MVRSDSEAESMRIYAKRCPLSVKSPGCPQAQLSPPAELGILPYEDIFKSTATGGIHWEAEVRAFADLATVPPNSHSPITPLSINRRSGLEGHHLVGNLNQNHTPECLR